MYNIAAELENRGIQQGIQTGICAMVEFCREQGFTRESTATKITEKFSLPPDEAEHCTNQYWGA